MSTDKIKVAVRVRPFNRRGKSNLLNHKDYPLCGHIRFCICINMPILHIQVLHILCTQLFTSLQEFIKKLYLHTLIYNL